ARVPDSMILSLGLINGRNIWRADLEKAIAGAEHAVKVLGPDRVFVGPSCSLLHSPVDIAYEDHFDEDLRGWLAFAKQKLQEISVVAHVLNEGRESVRTLLDENRKAVEGRRISTRVHNPAVKKRLSEVNPDMLRRNSSFSTRKPLQQNRLNLPILPTTTIGSFPQTREVRAARAAFRAERIREDEYESFLQDEIEKAIRFQEEIGLDVLVHGEFERNDMVEYFGEQFSGFAATQNGWVQSYGSRCVKPPIIYGDLRRLQPMTVPWWRYAQSLTQKPVKGMLTGPVTVLQWSFVRDDQSREETCRQIALAIRNEVQDLEAAGCTIIQIDEPAIREGVPLRQADRPGYLAWAVDAFRLASSGVRDDTQIHTHMCYSEFSEIIEAIAALDADVLSIETSRSQLDLLRIFAEFHYPNEIGPGVYDIHSPRVPSDQEIELLLEEILNVLPARQVWVNPDCGLKTRRWEEVKPALANMVRAAKTIRARCIP
ncbi:MAG TPA: 5-methyltetrahydropteroyltriglutamate--homocysteine S-methyltransferase, partial [bacterium]|nr:5-methyltetrahydropteroyltriglutamate--homocysteine S-methyltransferase [bacterium]